MVCMYLVRKMTSDCKLCVSLGASTLEEMKAHSEVHTRQLRLINQSEGGLDTKLTIQNGNIRKEKSKKDGLLRFSRELVNIHGRRDCGIKCSQCEHSIKSKRCTANTAYSLISHACIHLNKDLFACRQCQLKFVSRNGTYRHLQKTHSLRGVRANYIDMMKDHQSDITDMIKLCFGKAPQKQLNITPFGKQKKNNQGQDPLLKLAYGCLDKHPHSDRIQCNLCPTSITSHKRVKAASRLLDHARWHLDKPIFSCRLCQYSSSSECAVNSHLKNSHTVAQSKQNFKDGSKEYFEEISSTLEDCFGDMKKERPPVITREEKRTRNAQSCIRSRCGTKSLLAERKLRCWELAQKFQRSGKLECRICRVHLSVVTASNAYMGVPMQHTLVHLNKILFNCRRCSYTTTTKTAIRIHVRSKHNVPTPNEFDDHTDDFHADFMDMISKCFDWDLGASIVAPVVAPKNYPCKIISKMHDKCLKAVRHVHASELIRNHAKDGKILCRICSDRTTIFGKADSKSVFGHAIAHLDSRIWPYRCKLCSHISVYLTSTRRHLRITHKDKDAREFEDVSDKFHLDIMEVLSKCYDWSLE